MKYIELKDLTPGDNLILAFKDLGYNNKYYPFEVKVEKGINIIFIDIEEPDEIISYHEFHHLKKGIDINGNTVIELGVFDNMDECKKWCDFENKLIDKCDE